MNIKSGDKEREKDMERRTVISFTVEEINALQISICAEQLKLQEDIDHLKEHNKTGINTNKIKQKEERIKDLEALFDKLYEAEQIAQ